MKFQIKELVDDWEVKTVRLGSDTIAAGGALVDNDRSKFVKLVGESRFGLAVAGDVIEGWVTSVEVASYDGYRIGGVADADDCYKEVTFDGLQATPGTGVLAINDYVVVGTPVAGGTALPSGVAAKVTKATDQSAAKASPFASRVVSLGSAGTGAVGTIGVIQCL